MKLLPVRPHPEPEEAITSWLSRLADVYGFGTQPFCRLVLGKLAQQDLDLVTNEKTYVRLEQMTGLASEQLKACHSVFGFPNVKFEESLTFHGLPWIFLNRIRAVRRWYCQVCPACLREGLPYYRRAWRLALFCICLSHRCYLLDVCPTCRQPINVLEFVKPGTDRFTRCHTCNFDLAQVATKSASSEDCSLTQEHLGLLSGQSYPLLERLNTDGASYFSVLHLICHRLTQKIPRLKAWQILVTAAAGVRSLPDSSACANKTNFFEYYPDAQSRQLILRAASMLLADWPTSFLNTAIPSGASTSDFVQLRTRYPSWFRAVLRDHLPSKINGSDEGF